MRMSITKGIDTDLTLSTEGILLEGFDYGTSVLISSAETSAAIAIKVEIGPGLEDNADVYADVTGTVVPCSALPVQPPIGVRAQRLKLYASEDDVAVTVKVL